MNDQEAKTDPIRELEPWFHNIHLPDGTQTAANHFLGDFPRVKWNQISGVIPKDLSGWSALDIGCNAGFYSFELAKRGAKVLGIDSDPHYLRQAQWVSTQLQLSNPPAFRQMQIHDLARLNSRFDLVLFMGVFYHLRYPVLALDTVAEKVNRLMIFQSLSSPGEKVLDPEDDYSIDQREVMQDPGWPKMAFIEKKFSSDETNWWAPNHSAMLSLLRSTGFAKIERVSHEIYLCQPPRSGVVSNREWPEDEWKAATGAKESPGGHA